MINGYSRSITTYFAFSGRMLDWYFLLLRPFEHFLDMSCLHLRRKTFFNFKDTFQFLMIIFISASHEL